MRGRKFSGSTQRNNSDVISIKNVIQDIAQEEIKKFGFPTYKAAIVQKINDDGTVDVYLPPNKENLVTNVLNKCGEILMVNDSVEIATKNGSLTNCWVALKHGTIVQGHAEEVEQLSGEVVMKVQNGRLSVTELQRDASLGNAFTIIAEDINLDGMNIVLNGSRGITITSPYFNVTSQGYITATGGTIGGWTLGEKRLYSGAGTNYVALDSGTNNVNYAIWAGNATPANAPFNVTRAGKLTATGIDVTGDVKATSGTFGNGTNKITIGTNNTSNSAIYSGSKSTLNSTNAGFYIGTNGIALGAYNSTTGNPFQVTTAGKLTARDVIVSGEITATSGTIGGCSISNGILQIANANIGSLSVDKITAGSNSAAVSFSNITADGGKIGGWKIDTVQLQKQIGEYSFEIRSDRASNDPALLVYKNSGSNQGYKWYVRPDGFMFATDAYIVGTVEGSTVNGSTISGSTVSGSTIIGGTININNQFSVNSFGEIQMSKNGGFLSFRHSDHPFVSALNCSVGSGGLIFVGETSQDESPTTQWARINAGYDNGSYGLLTAATWYCGSYGDGWEIATKRGGYPSTRNLKTNLENIEDEYEDIYDELKNINMYTYEYKYDGIKEDKKDYGFVIDEFDEAEHLSKYVLNYDRRGKIVDNKLIKYNKGTGEKDYNPDAEGYNFKYKDWDRDSYFKMSLILIKSLQHKIDKLEKIINTLQC